MKPTPNNDPRAQLVPVHFEFTHPTATSVSVAGTFNRWQPEAKALHGSGGGRWVKESALPPGTYEYCLVVDGHWMADPLVTESVPNPYGGRNSVLRVVSKEATHLTGAENLPMIMKDTSNASGDFKKARTSGYNKPPTPRR